MLRSRRTLQNTYLWGCVQNTAVTKIRRGPRKDNFTAASHLSYVYTVTTGQKSVKVCQAAFVALHGIKATRLKKKVLQFDTDIMDGRSKHDQHPKIDNKIMNKIRQRIKDVSCLREPLQSFPRTLTKLTLMHLSMLQQCTKTFLHKIVT